MWPGFQTGQKKISELTGYIEKHKNIYDRKHNLLF